MLWGSGAGAVSTQHSLGLYSHCLHSYGVSWGSGTGAVSTRIRHACNTVLQHACSMPATLWLLDGNGALPSFIGYNSLRSSSRGETGVPWSMRRVCPLHVWPTPAACTAQLGMCAALVPQVVWCSSSAFTVVSYARAHTPRFDSVSTLCCR